MQDALHGWNIVTCLETICVFMDKEYDTAFLSSQGTPYGKPTPSVAGRMSAEACARKIVRAVAGGKKEVSVGGLEVWLGIVSLFFPRFYEIIIRKRSKEFLPYR
jgi:hypothetical protein